MLDDETEDKPKDELEDSSQSKKDSKTQILQEESENEITAPVVQQDQEETKNDEPGNDENDQKDKSADEWRYMRNERELALKR